MIDKAKSIKHKPVILWLVTLSIIFIMYGVFKFREITSGDWMQIMLMTALVTVTAFYAWSAKRQADASAVMAEEMKSARFSSFRPIVTLDEVKMSGQKQIALGFKLNQGKLPDTLPFHIHNIGNGPAFDMRWTILHSG